MEFSPSNSAREEMKSGQMMSSMSGSMSASRKEGKGMMMPRFMSFKLLIVVVLVLQVAIAIYILPFSPLYIFQAQTIANQVVNEVSRLTAVNVNEAPQVAVVADPDTLRKANDIQAAVYKDAVKGDYVIVYSDKMIIFRRNDNKIVYEGDSPATIADKNQKSLISAIQQKAKDAKLISSDSTETPQLSVVTDPAVVKSQDATFYKDVAKDDVIALFSTAKVIVLFRPSTGNMINSGAFNTAISAR